jgi:His-Xaa-Ser repeat protein HxsA
MNHNDKKQFQNLAKKTLSVLAGSLAILSGTKAVAANTFTDNGSDNTTTASKRVLKPKFVLKLNISDPSRSMTMMHTSHSSHSSHASHASHSSHASSSPGYTPSTYSPASTYTPTRVAPAYRPARPVYTSPLTDTVTQRTLYKGLKGDDVKLMQQYLKAKGYTVPVSGYFGAQTELAVKSFQKLSDLPETGKADKLTLSMIEGL